MNTYHILVPTPFKIYLDQNQNDDTELRKLWDGAKILDEIDNQVGAVQYEGTAEELQSYLDENIGEPIVLETLTNQQMVDYGYEGFASIAKNS